MSDDFPVFAQAIRARYAALATEELFVADVSDLAAVYLVAFPPGTNTLFRTRTEHDCSSCKAFLRHLGRCVALDADGTMRTLWDDSETLPWPYNLVAARLEAAVRAAPIVSVFRSQESAYGVASNYDRTTTLQWHHLAGPVAARHATPTPGAVCGASATSFQVCQRGLIELMPAAVATVLDLMDADALYRGEQFRPLVADFVRLQIGYTQAVHPTHFIWAHLQSPGALLRNMAIGTLVQDLSAGVDVETAVRAYERKVAGDHYQRPTAVITPRMVDAALATLSTLGLEGAVHRRYARLSDVSVQNVLFVDPAVRPQMRGGLAGLLLDEAVAPEVTVDHARPIPVASFMAELLPAMAHMDVLLTREHLPRFVSLTAPAQADTGRLFQWGNDFAWSYDGDMADAITQRVQAAGGKTHAALRVSLAWSNYDDLDLHSDGPDGHTYFAHRQDILDVDMNAGEGHTRTPVENQAWEASRLQDGQYVFSVHNYMQREHRDGGFTLQVATPDRLEHFAYPALVRQNQRIPCLVVTVTRGQVCVIGVLCDALKPQAVTQTKWGLTTGTRIPVETIMLSPNYWDGQTCGNRHWFFFLRGCVNPGSARGFYNEFLHAGLAPHRKVFEVLGRKLGCPPSASQLSGLGFASTQRASLTCLVRGPRMSGAYTIQF